MNRQQTINKIIDKYLDKDLENKVEESHDVYWMEEHPRNLVRRIIKKVLYDIQKLPKLKKR